MESNILHSLISTIPPQGIPQQSGVGGQQPILPEKPAPQQGDQFTLGEHDKNRARSGKNDPNGEHFLTLDEF